MFTILVVAEGAKPKGGNVVVQRVVRESTDPIRLGGISFVLGSQIEKMTDIETRIVVMGHLQRSGVPTPFDRVLITKLSHSFRKGSIIDSGESDECRFVIHCVQFVSQVYFLIILPEDIDFSPSLVSNRI